MGLWAYGIESNDYIHIWRWEKNWLPCCHLRKIGWLSHGSVDPGGIFPCAFPPGSKADRHRDFTWFHQTLVDHDADFASISRFWIAQEGHVFCAGSNHKRETEVNKQRTSFLKGRNQFSSEVWRMVGLINCGYAEVGSSFQDILDTRSYVLCTKSKHFQTPPKAQRNIYI